MKGIILYLRNWVISDKESLFDNWTRLLIYGLIIGIFKFLTKFIELQFIQEFANYCILFLIGAAYSFNQNRYRDSLISGLVLLSLVIIIDSLLKSITTLNPQDQYNVFGNFILLRYLLKSIPYVVIGIISNYKVTIKYMVLGAVGGILYFFYSQIFLWHDFVIVNQLSDSNILLSAFMIDLQNFYNSLYFNSTSAFILPVIFLFSINPAFIKFLISFQNRVNRTQFLIPYLFLYLIQAVLTYLLVFTIHNFIHERGELISVSIYILHIVIYSALYLFLSIGIIALCVKRLHASDHSGWWLLLIFIPLVNLYLIYLLILKRGDKWDNDYTYVI